MAMKQITVNGQIFECYSWDGGKSWSSSPKAAVTFLRRKNAILGTRLSQREQATLDLLNEVVPGDGSDADSIRTAVRMNSAQ